MTTTINAETTLSLLACLTDMQDDGDPLTAVRAAAFIEIVNEALLESRVMLMEPVTLSLVDDRWVLVPGVAA